MEDLTKRTLANLNNLLEEGQLKGLAVVWIETDGGVYIGYPSGDIARLMLGLDFLKKRVLESMGEGKYEENN